MKAEIVVQYAPTGKGRPRFVRATGRTYTPKATESAEAAVRSAWFESGHAMFPPDVPLIMVVQLAHDRPASHFKRDGTYSAVGLREVHPCRQKPDVDNALKLVMDALEKYAYARDVAIVAAHVHRRWCAVSEGPHMRITIETVT